MIKKVRRLSEFIDRVGAIRETWNMSSDKELWFRGEDKTYEETALRPKLFRPDKQGVLKPVSELLKMEIRLYREFKDYGLTLCTETIQRENWYWDQYFLMQHHGAPTRLLDWSDGSLIGLHFAIRHKEKDNTIDAVVYVTDPDRLKTKLERLPGYNDTKRKWRSYIKEYPEFRKDDQDSYLPPEDDDDLKKLPVPKLPCVLQTPHITRRVAAQRSRFVLFGSDPTWFYKEFEKSDSLIQRIIIPGPAIHKIKNELRGSGITESVIFPDLDGLGREMEQLWQGRK